MLSNKTDGISFRDGIFFGYSRKLLSYAPLCHDAATSKTFKVLRFEVLGRLSSLLFFHKGPVHFSPCLKDPCGKGMHFRPERTISRKVLVRYSMALPFPLLHLGMKRVHVVQVVVFVVALQGYKLLRSTSLLLDQPVVAVGAVSPEEGSAVRYHRF